MTTACVIPLGLWRPSSCVQGWGSVSLRGVPVRVARRLALVSVSQFAEGLTDRQAAHAARARIDGKYALG